MNAKAAATGLASATIPGSIIVGVTLAVSAVAGLRAQRDHYAALAARPRPTATVTQVTSPPPRPTSPPAAATPQPRPSATPVAQHPALGANPRPGRQGALASPPGGAMAVEQTPPNSATTPASSCSGRIVSVRLHLGVLPTCAV